MYFAATLRQKSQIPLSISPGHIILTPGRPVPLDKCHRNGGEGRCLFLGRFASLPCAGVSQGRICSDLVLETEVSDPTFYLTQSQCTCNVSDGRICSDLVLETEISDPTFYLTQSQCTCNVSDGRICSDLVLETEVSDPTFYLTQSQCTCNVSDGRICSDLVLETSFRSNFLFHTVTVYMQCI